MNKQVKNYFKLQPVNLSLIFGMVLVYLYGVIQSFGLIINVDVLFKDGAQYYPAVVGRGEWWRLLTAGFLHVSPSHLLFNLVVMYFVGKLLEWQIGHLRYLVLFVLSVMAGNLLSLGTGAMNGVSAGASGGIYGLFGAMIALGFLDRDNDFWKREARIIGLLVGLSIFMALFQSGIDLAAHIGGGIMGMLLTPILLVKNPNMRQIKINWRLQMVAIIGVVLFVALGFMLALGRL